MDALTAYRQGAAEFPVTTWTAANDIGFVPELGYRLRWGAEPGQPVRLYWEHHYASPTSRYHTLRRWIVVDVNQYEHELNAAARAGLALSETRDLVERRVKTARLRSKRA